MKRLKSELQSSRCLEQELRSQIASLSFSDRTTKSELYQLRQENESLQSKYESCFTFDFDSVLFQIDCEFFILHTITCYIVEACTNHLRSYCYS